MTLGQLLSDMGKMSVMAFLLALTLTALILTLIYIQVKDDALDLRWLLLDDSTGHPSVHKLGLLVSLIVSTWGFIYHVQHGTLSEMYLTIYMGVWAGSTAVSTYLNRGPR